MSDDNLKIRLRSVAILIECDNQNNLGKACQRDVVNVTKRLVKNNPDNWNIYIFTFTPSYFVKLLSDVNVNNQNHIKAVLSREHKMNFEQILQKAKLDNGGEINELYIHVSGHGYSNSDSTRNELDGRSEYIITPTQVLSDNTMYNILLKNIDKNTKIRIAVDTCRSGTFSNFQYQFDNSTYRNAVRNPKPYFTNAWSISSCLDSQSSMNDIGEISGFGGSLTVQMLDNLNVFENFMSSDRNEISKSLNSLKPILAKLRQTPLLLCDNNK
jgi:hypothetical protein